MCFYFNCEPCGFILQLPSVGMEAVLAFLQPYGVDIESNARNLIYSKQYLRPPFKPPHIICFTFAQYYYFLGREPKGPPFLTFYKDN